MARSSRRPPLVVGLCFSPALPVGGPRCAPASGLRVMVTSCGWPRPRRGDRARNGGHQPTLLRYRAFRPVGEHLLVPTGSAWYPPFPSRSPHCLRVPRRPARRAGTSGRPWRRGRAPVVSVLPPACGKTFVQVAEKVTGHPVFLKSLCFYKWRSNFKEAVKRE